MYTWKQLVEKFRIGEIICDIISLAFTVTAVVLLVMFFAVFGIGLTWVVDRLW